MIWLVSIIAIVACIAVWCLASENTELEETLTIKKAFARKERMTVIELRYHEGVWQ